MKLKLLGVVAALALVFTGCDQGKKQEAGNTAPKAKAESAAPAQGDTIKLAVVGPYSGDLASYGIPARNAARIAVAKINAAGGVLGKQIELLEEDDVCDPNTSTSVAAKLVSKGVTGVIGHLCSGATEVALGPYLEAKIIAISAASTNPSLTLEGKYPNFFRTIAHDAAQAVLQSDYAVNTLGVKKVAVIHDKAAYGKVLAELAKANLEKAGVEIAMFEGVTPGAVDYSAIVRKINRSGADTVVFGGYHPEASKIVTQARKKGLKINFISGDGVKDPSLIEIAGEYAEGYYATAPQDTSKLPMAQEMISTYKAEFGEDPGTFSAAAYAGVLAFANAIEKAGTTDYDAVRAKLLSESVSTTIGNIGFDANGDVTGTGFAMYQVVNGKFVKK